MPHRVLELAVDRGLYRVDLRSKTYRYVGRNPKRETLTPIENACNKQQLHGLRRVLRDGTTKVFVDPTWPFTEENTCSKCFCWVPRDAPCDHDKYQCPVCSRRRCVLHWRYPMKTQREALQFLKSAQVQTGKECFVHSVKKQRANAAATA